MARMGTPLIILTPKSSISLSSVVTKSFRTRPIFLEDHLLTRSRCLIRRMLIFRVQERHYSLTIRMPRLEEPRASDQ